MKRDRLLYVVTVLLSALMGWALNGCSSDGDDGGALASARLMGGVDTVRVTDSTSQVVTLFYGKGVQTYYAHATVSWKSADE